MNTNDKIKTLRKAIMRVMLEMVTPESKPDKPLDVKWCYKHLARALKETE